MFQSLYLINTQLISNKTLFIVRNPLAKRLGGFLCAVSPSLQGFREGQGFYAISQLVGTEVGIENPEN